MAERKVSLEELATFNDGTCIDMGAVEDNNESSWNLVKDEISDFLARPRVSKPPMANNFYSTIPSSALKKSIESILRARNAREEVLRKHVQHEFDMKMNRIRRIKSKTYRKMRRREKLKNNELLERDSKEIESFNASSEDDSCKSEGIQEFRPVLSFNNQTREDSSESEICDSQCALVASAFQTPGYECNEKDFLLKKAETIRADAPQVIESPLPGWDNSWAGEGVEFKKTKFNTTIERKEGIRSQDREDFGKGHVIISEHVKIPEKYMSKLPYGFSSKDYKAKICTPISIETNSLRIFNRFVKVARKNDSVAGKKIDPCEYDPEY